jgi:hypothetical protein
VKEKSRSGVLPRNEGSLKGRPTVSSEQFEVLEGGGHGGVRGRRRRGEEEKREEEKREEERRRSVVHGRGRTHEKGSLKGRPTDSSEQEKAVRVVRVW